MDFGAKKLLAREKIEWSIRGYQSEVTDSQPSMLPSTTTEKEGKGSVSGERWQSRLEAL
jgi:hypothetical protein